jgi:hypothetical protein
VISKGLSISAGATVRISLKLPPPADSGTKDVDVKVDALAKLQTQFESGVDVIVLFSS